MRSRHRAVVQTPVTAVVPGMAFLSDGRMLKCASLCADDNVNTYAAAFHIKHAVSRSRSPPTQAPSPLPRSNTHLNHVFEFTSIVLCHDVDCRTYCERIHLAGRHRQRRLRRNNEAEQLRASETDAFQYGPCEDTPPLLEGDTPARMKWSAWHEQDYSHIFLHVQKQRFLFCIL